MYKVSRLEPKFLPRYVYGQRRGLPWDYLLDADYVFGQNMT